MIFLSLSLSMVFVFLFPLMTQPLSMGLILLLLSVSVCLMLSIYVVSWVGYILFLVYVGGLLVMFAYVSVLGPNSLYKSFSKFFFFGFVCVVVSIVVLLIFMSSGVGMEYNFGLEVAGMDMYSGLFVVLYSFYSMSVVIGLGLILLLTLVGVIKICYFFSGPLRPFF